MIAPQPSAVRFGVFELDPAAGELRKHGVRIKLHDKPNQILNALLERPGQVVTRQELQERLWPGDTFVEFENGLNNAISRLREALGDSADSPRYIETLPRRGYRFLAPVEVLEVSPGQQPGALTSQALGAGLRQRWKVPAMILLAGALAFVAYRLGNPPRSPIQSVAVLPFVTGDAREGSDDEYLAFGMTEALITELSRHAGLKVISQTSVMRYKGARKPLPEIARELGVGAVIEGSVVREGDVVRITVQLIDARTDVHLWAQTYRREASKALSVQSELARAIVQEIGVRLLTAEQASPPPSSPANAASQEAYLKGRFFLQKPGKERDPAGAYFEQAIAADPNSAQAHSGVADYYLLADSIAPLEGIPKARIHAQKALALNDRLAGAHASSGFVYFYGAWDWKRAESAFRRALELDPNHTLARRWLASFLSAMGRRQEAAAEIERVLQLDPVSFLAHDSAAGIWLNGRQYARVIEQGKKILELDPNDPRAYEHLANGYLYLGDHQNAIDAVRKAMAVSGTNAAYLYQQAIVLGHAGRKKEALESVAQARRLAPAEYVPDLFLAAVYAQVGEVDEAFRFLEAGFRSRDVFMVTLKVTPFFDPLRADPRFQKLLRRMNFPD